MFKFVQQFFSKLFHQSIYNDQDCGCCASTPIVRSRPADMRLDRRSTDKDAYWDKTLQAARQGGCSDS